MVFLEEIIEIMHQAVATQQVFLLPPDPAFLMIELLQAVIEVLIGFYIVRRRPVCRRDSTVDNNLGELHTAGIILITYCPLPLDMNILGLVEIGIPD